MKRSVLVYAVLVLSLVIVSFVPAVSAQETQDIVDIAVADGRFETLVAAVTAAGLVDALKQDGPITVFAPTDDAFNKLPEGTLESLVNNVPALTDILLYHVVAGKVMAADVVELESADTLLGKPLTVAAHDDGTVMINDAQVLITDIEASNGVIHVIDAVLLLPFSVTNEGANNLNFRAGPGLDAEIIGVFPIDARAEALARNEAGDWVQIEYDGQVGWVFAPLTTPSGDVMELPVALNNIVEIAVADGRFTTLVTAVQAAELAETLSGEGPFTVFAPTDDAFDMLPEGTVEALLEDIPTLTDILLYHVVEGKVMAADVVGLETATTLQGADIAITVTDGNVFLNGDVQVIITDIEASNGVIHVIDAVLLPPGM